MKTKTKKMPNGMRGNKLKIQKRNKNVMMFALSVFAFLLGGALFNDVFAGVVTATIATFVPVVFKEDPTKTDEQNALEKIRVEVKNLLGQEGELTKKELKELAEKIDALKENSTSKEVKDELIRLATEFKAFKERGNGNQFENTVKGQIFKFIADNADEIKRIRKAGAGVIELKAVGVMETASATVPDGIPALQGVQSAPPSNVNLRGAIVDSLVSRLATSLASYPYTETIPKDGDFSFVAEKDTKPEIDFKTETRYAAPKKIAAWIGLTEEVVTDIPGLQSIAYDYLRKKHDLKREDGILFGDGIDPNLKGATKYGRAFSAGALANTVTDPNLMDCINAAITDIYTTHNYQDEMPYMANLVLINPVDFFIELVSAKDGFGHPLYPTASLFNRVVIGGVTIIPFENIPAGKIFVADMSKYNITDYVGYTVKIGWINDDFIRNQFVILGESRLHGFVKKLDEQAFIYDDIATIKTAITAV